ncbi:Ger(x)C family spore germination protein [Clostridium sp. YIM B02515]|uniref:Ger(X)C family spore germination protein n=1 Tax=Clostridium rhizosphaerae TaxID=2803861 RepID=A0ABS1TEU2_9CLOT|nr:Ger(x)C family spore germination protein [Clostridium rhizosphaerae]MBL4937267.1 Ger(x)C family spore germination protein [Clostridium rhizosphaerae]
MKGKQTVILISLVLLFISYIYDTNMKPVENMQVLSGAGYDIIEEVDGHITYSIPLSVYVFGEDNKITGEIKTGIGSTIGMTRGDRQRKSDNKFLLGLEKVYVISEDYAKFGIRNILDVLFTNSEVNDMGAVIVYNGKAEELLGYQVNGYPTSSDYLEGVIKNAQGYNFFTNNYKLTDVFVRVDSEGRKALIPYVEIKKTGPEVAGFAVFNKDKMVDKVNMQEGKILNLLREKKARGALNLQKDAKSYVDYYCEARRKVKVKKDGDNYKFIIDLNLEGDITSNEEFPSVIDNPELKKKLEAELSDKIEDECNAFIQKMKCEYKLDLLELGRVAAANFGRHQNKDWDKIVSTSDIKVNVKVKVDKEGRGNY